MHLYMRGFKMFRKLHCRMLHNSHIYVGICFIQGGVVWIGQQTTKSNSLVHGFAFDDQIELYYNEWFQGTLKGSSESAILQIKLTYARESIAYFLHGI